MLLLWRLFLFLRKLRPHDLKFFCMESFVKHTPHEAGDTVQKKVHTVVGN